MLGLSTRRSRRRSKEIIDFQRWHGEPGGDPGRGGRQSPASEGGRQQDRGRGERPVLVALGIRSDGKKEIIDFLALAESAAQWEQFLTDLFRRGLEGGRLEMVCVDGAAGLLAALPIVYPGLPVQRCWAHKIRNVLDKVRKADHDTVKAGLHDVMNATTLTAARSRRAPFRRPLAGRLPQSRRVPAQRPRRVAHLLALSDTRKT